jgi:arabinofuranosyltransferase
MDFQSKTRYQSIISQLPYIIVVIVYTLWAIFFIFNTSFIAIDGKRYFSLIDDAMISMRYAWNFSHGSGLVWNTGERVEGYSNLLMTLIMSLATWGLDKRNAVLAIQILGIPTVLLSGFLAKAIALEVFKKNANSKILAFGVFFCTIIYYPLSYWSLMGNETGLVIVLTLSGVYLTIKWTQTQVLRDLVFSAILFGLAFLTRNDAMIFAMVNFAYLTWVVITENKKNGVRNLAIAFLILTLFIVAQLAFRQLYYGELVPNTYTLKIGKIPLPVRLNDGLLYIYHFARETWMFLVLTLLGAFLIRGRFKWLPIGFLIIAIIYEVWTGGDTFLYWRFILPSIPLIIILSTGTLDSVVNQIIERMKKKFSNLTKQGVHPPYVSAIVSSIILILLVVKTVSPYWKNMTLLQKIDDQPNNMHNTNVAIAINAVTKPDAKIAVFWAGAIPYYADRFAIDFLGKSDKHIAELYPNIPSKVIWFQQTTLPGHNKYDLRYSMETLKPTYIQRYYWGSQNLRAYAIRNYVRFEYQIGENKITLMLRMNDPNVYWDKGTIFPSE